jgi:site-specific recombinase XerD
MINYLPAFRDFLHAQKFAAKTVRNYASDVSQFLAWLAPRSPERSRRGEVGVQHFLDYKLHLESLNIPRSTLTRHLSALRKFAQFLNLPVNLDNPQLPLIPSVLKNFRYYLKQRRYKSKTVVNYLSDIRHYLNWYESK